MRPYNEMKTAAALFLMALAIIAGFFLWCIAGLVRGANHDFLPEDGIYDCEELNASIELSPRGSFISLGEDTYRLLIAYSGDISYLTTDDSTSKVEYGYIEKRLFPPDDKLCIHVMGQQGRFLFTRRGE